MPFPLIPAIAGAVLGIGAKAVDNAQQRRQQQKLNEDNMKYEKEMTDYNVEKQYDMWQRTNYGAQKEQLQKAGLNPGLMYGMSGAGGATANISTGSSPNSQANTGGGAGEHMGMGIQMELLQAQKRVLESQAAKNEAEAAKTAGVDTANVQADTENKILQKIVTEYTGKEAKDVYEQIKAPNRSIEAKTYQDEMEARQGVAGTLYELWKEGKLKDKSVAEIEQILLANAKTREETRNIYKAGELLEQNIKGAKLDNIIKQLEADLQTQTGIDKNSPGFLKILGRLFVQLMSK